ncbi:MAG: hypothetical protein C5B43_04200, partial [Verrucomicrobia bacterium]
IKENASLHDIQGLLTYMTGVSYFERLSRAEEFLRRMHKLPIFPVFGFGLSKLSPDLTSKSSNISGKGDLIGQPILRYPQVDMMFYEFNGIANSSLHPEYGHDPIANAVDYHLLSITDGSSNEHQVLNDVFDDKYAISTVKLLQLAHKRGHERGGGGFLVLTQANFENFEKEQKEFKGHSLQSIKSELGSQWKIIAESLGYNLDLGSYEIKNVDQFHAISFVTPGLVCSDDGDPNDPNKPPSYSGAGALIFSSHQWQALISGNESYIHGGYGSKLPEKTFEANNVKNLKVVQDADNHFNIKGVKNSGNSPFEKRFPERINLIPGESFEETVNAFFKSPQAKKILGKNYQKEDFYKDFIEPTYNPKVPTKSFSNPSVHDVPNYNTVAADTFANQPWNADKDKWKDVKGSDLNSEPSAEMRRTLNAEIKDKGHLKAEAHPKHRSPFSMAADPVDIVSGAFYLNEVDLVINGPFKIELCRNYSSLNSLEGDFGYGWKRNIVGHLDLRAGENGDEVIHAAEDDGTVIVYRKKKDDSIFKIYSEDNPTLSNHSALGTGGQWSKLNSRIEYLKVGEDEHYILYSSDGSQRIYKVRMFPIAGLERKRPYLEKWIDKNGNALYFEHGEVKDIGNVVQYDYGNIKKIYNQIGDWLKFSYNAKGYVTQAYTNDGRNVQYRYDDSTDNLISVTLADGAVIEYDYDTEFEVRNDQNVLYSKHLITREKRPEGRVLENIYDAKRRVRIQKACVGQNAKPLANAAFEYEKEASGEDPQQIVNVRDANGNLTKHYIYQWKIYKIQDPLGNIILQSWYLDKDHYIDAVLGVVKEIPSDESRGFPFALKEEKDKRGLITRYTYNQWGNVVTSEVVGENLTGGGINSIKTHYNYEANNPSLISESYHFGSDGLKHGTRYYYDQNFPALVSRVEEYMDAAIVSTFEYKYESNDQVRGMLKELKQSGLPGEVPYKAIYENDARGKIIQKRELTHTKDPDVVTYYKYNELGQCFEERDSAGNRVKYHFDAMGRCLSSIHYDKEGNVLKKAHNYYNQNGDIAWKQGTMQDPEDITYYHYDYAGRLLAEVNSYFKYDRKSKRLIEPKAPYNYGGAITLYEYDILGNQIRKVDPNGHITNMAYDVIGRLISAFDEIHNLSYEYEPGGKVAKIKDSSESETSYEYTLLGWPRKVISPNSVIEYFYDIEGRVIKEVHGKEVFIVNYDDKKRTEERISLSNNAKELTRYDFRGNVLEHIDAANNVFIYIYDGLGRVVSEQGPEKNRLEYSYDGNSNSVTITDDVSNKKVLTRDGVDRITRLDYLNSKGDLIETHQYEYLKNGFQVNETSGNDNARFKSKLFDQNGNVILEIIYSDYEDGFIFQKIVEYDKNGNPIKIFDSGNSETVFKYDAKNRMAEKIFPDGSVIKYEYDLSDNLIGIRLPEGLTWKGSFDLKTGNLLTDKLIVSGEDNRIFEYSYEENKLKKLVDPRGIIFEYHYDESGNLKEIKTNTGETRTYEYDIRGLLNSVIQEGSNGRTKVSRQYDGNKNILEESIFINEVLHQKTYQKWNANKCRSSLNVIDGSIGSEREFNFNAANRMTTCKISGTKIKASYDYREDGSLRERNLFEGEQNKLRKKLSFSKMGDLPAISANFLNGTRNILYEKATWDSSNKLVGYNYKKSKDLYAHTYDYDERERYIKGKVQKNGMNHFDEAYLYNSLDTLLETVTNTDEIEKSNEVKVLYGPQVQGHEIETKKKIKKSKISKKSEKESKYNDEVCPNNSTLTYQYRYDEVGNVIRIYDLNTDIDKKLYWNAWNQLIRVEEGDNVWTATYDALGRRLLVKSEYNGKSSEIKSFYDPEVEFLEIGLEVDGHKVWKLYGPDLNGEYGEYKGIGGLEALIDSESGKVVYLVSDLFGHIAGYFEGNFENSLEYNQISWNPDIIDPYGNVEWKYLEQKAEGAKESSLTRVAKSIFWRSRRSDITGLVFMGARYYHSLSGRFISPDPLGLTGSLDLYNYADGDPINYFDPDGRLLMASWGNVKDFSAKHG